MPRADERKRREWQFKRERDRSLNKRSKHFDEMLESSLIAMHWFCSLSHCRKRSFWERGGGSHRFHYELQGLWVLAVPRHSWQRVRRPFFTIRIGFWKREWIMKWIKRETWKKSQICLPRELTSPSESGGRDLSKSQELQVEKEPHALGGVEKKFSLFLYLSLLACMTGPFILKGRIP